MLEDGVLFRLRDEALAGERSPEERDLWARFRSRACQPSSEACPEVTLHLAAFPLLPYFVTQPEKQGIFGHRSGRSRMGFGRACAGQRFFSPVAAELVP